MKEIAAYIESGIIEAYVLGLASAGEIKEVEYMAAAYIEVRQAIDTFSELLEEQAMANAVVPDPLIKPMLMATIDFISRMGKGETPSFPPELNENSTAEDYTEWLNRPDFILPSNFSGIHAKIIAHSPQMTTAVVWISDKAGQETHHNEYEKFLVVDGSCIITVANSAHSLGRGDYFAIPLHKSHDVKVTSAIPCKVVLQRVAA